MKIDILILNYNGRKLMEQYLPSVCVAAESSDHECKVHVVDNLSSDDSVQMLRDSFPKVIVHVAKENRVLCSYNDVVADLDSDVVIFLNNDIKVEPDFVDPLITCFTDGDVMFVAPKILNFDGTYNGGRSCIRAEYGVIKIVVDIDRIAEHGETMAISTGAFRRSMFLDLGGFDDLYLPGIWEDVDLCFRGLKQGRKGVYAPESVIWHDESTTFNREFGKRRKLRLAHRNMFLFVWRNICDRRLLAQHLLFLPARIIYSFLCGRPELGQAFFLAVRKLPKALGKRRMDRAQHMVEKLKDSDIIV